MPLITEPHIPDPLKPLVEAPGVPRVHAPHHLPHPDRLLTAHPLPLTDRRIPIVADEAVDPAFGSGAVKVTPAHDPTDFEIGQRHQLAQIDVMTPEARMAETVPERFQGLDRTEARKRAVAEFEALGLLVKVEEHRHGRIVDALDNRVRVDLAPRSQKDTVAFDGCGAQMRHRVAADNTIGGHGDHG